MKLRYLMPMMILAAGGCSTPELFATYEVPEAPGTAEAPWPRLVDTPVPSGDMPDPLTGIAVQAELGIASRAAAERASGLAGPVIEPGELPASASRISPAPGVDEEALAVRAASARERAQRLSAPVLSEAERQRLRAATR